MVMKSPGAADPSTSLRSVGTRITTSLSEAVRILVAAILILMAWHPLAGIAQVGAHGSCRTAVLYDSAERLFRVEPGVGPPVPVYPSISGPGSGASKPHMSPNGRSLA